MAQDLSIDDLATEKRRPILQFREDSHLGQLEVRHDGANLIARIKYDIDAKEDTFWIRFPRARAYRYHAEVHCTTYHLSEVFEQLAEITGSRWQTEVEAASTTSMWTLRHFMFYADSHGCLEVLAADFETGGMKPLPPVRD